VAETRAVVHLAAQNPRPEPTWSDAATFMDMTANLVAAAGESRAMRRFVFVSSSHVMGRYLNETSRPGELRIDLELGPGTVWRAGEGQMDATPYATAKVAGERLGRLLARWSGGRCPVVCLRIGWVQVGENLPRRCRRPGPRAWTP